jgi:hypothetical protein
MKKEAFVLIHFGNNIKYFELELYFINMLKLNTNRDSIYLYSIIDTPKEWVNIMSNFFTKVQSYDDRIITENTRYKSHYAHFNTLRTCAYFYAYNLIEYDKICIVESDMLVMSNLDNIFKLKAPAILFMDLNKNEVNNNNIIKYNKNYDCSKGSIVNGGVLLFKPSKDKYNKAIINLNEIIEKNCKYPNEALFLKTEINIYNVPIIYNYSHYELSKKLYKSPIKILHFNETTYKYLDIIRSNYINKIPEKRKAIEFFRTKYYNILSKDIEAILDKLK